MKILLVVLLTLSGCACRCTSTDSIDADVVFDPGYGSCAEVCPGEILEPWPPDDPQYWICRPSYNRCVP